MTKSELLKAIREAKYVFASVALCGFKGEYHLQVVKRDLIAKIALASEDQRFYASVHRGNLYIG